MLDLAFEMEQLLQLSLRFFPELKSRDCDPFWLCRPELDLMTERK